MMQLINLVNPDYNENLLSYNWTFANPIYTWQSNVLGAIIELTSSQVYGELNSLRIYHTSWDTNSIEVSPIDTSKYSFSVERGGIHSFSFKGFSKPAGSWFPEIEGEFRLIKNGNPLDYISFPFKIGNNTEPEFTFAYEKWQTFYQTASLNIGVVYTPTIIIPANPSFTPGFFELFLDGFKIEYVEDRVYNIPSYYTTPIKKEMYIEINSNTSLSYENEVVYVLANEFNIQLPSATSFKGKRFNIINGGDKVVTLLAQGIELIEGEPSKLIGVDTTLSIISTGTVWVIENRSRFYNIARTQWVSNIPVTSIANGASLNILTLLTDANKLANGTDNNKYELNIETDTIKTYWKGDIQTHTIRCTYTIATGSDQNFLLELRRTVDNTILGVEQVERNADTGLATAEFVTYTYGPLDPFITGGFNLTFKNNSGASVDLITNLNLFIETKFK